MIIFHVSNIDEYRSFRVKIDRGRFDFEKSKDEWIKLNRTFPSIFFRFVVGSSLAEGVKIGDRTIVNNRPDRV